ncbi:peptide MFS transporter [Pedobacter polaris]|uniref:Peptide MFS transporter n=1 Tax=Pedobacter polaris TaxID=2571273 RepID=A0A4U1CN38_9SPHI|nr:peptide MFS transporter [Pedobacter polaris]TKC06782.1 peptide MFS transporter [Pedobacter polaris]
MAIETSSSLNQDQALDLHLEKNGVATQKLLSHPIGLFVLFFTEMWERFSYYGMRALLTLFLISEIKDGGWNWTRPEALELYGWYTFAVFCSPIIGGYIADKLTGYRKAVILGALVMTLGHAAMAMEGVNKDFFYLGLLLLIIGNGLFKPNIVSIVGKLYPTGNDQKKDAAYTIFYMGINSGAFLGILMCGYVGEKIGWHWGFGLAGIFMFFGMLQFYFGQKIFGVIGNANDKKESIVKEQEEALPPKVVTQRMMVIGVLSIFTIFFWLVFEQAGGSMTIFAKDYTQRILSGQSGTIFKWVDAILTIFPLIAVSAVLIGLASKAAKKYPATIFFTALSFIILWGLAIWKVEKEFSAVTTEVPASWFGILNSFFIVALAPFFSKLWETKFNPTGPVKFAIGLIFVGLGFAGLAYGGMAIPKGAAVAQVSMFWLIFAYFFHTIGELCVSPVGLSYVSKLAPAKFIGLMFGVWYFCTGLGNKLAGVTGGLIDKINAEYSISTFFLIFTFIPIIAALILLVMSPLLRKWMHGVH